MNYTTVTWSYVKDKFPKIKFLVLPQKCLPEGINLWDCTSLKNISSSEINYKNCVGWNNGKYKLYLYIRKISTATLNFKAIEISLWMPQR